MYYYQWRKSYWIINEKVGCKSVGTFHAPTLSHAHTHTYTHAHMCNWETMINIIKETSIRKCLSFAQRRGLSLTHIPTHTRFLLCSVCLSVCLYVCLSFSLSFDVFAFIICLSFFTLSSLFLCSFLSLLLSLSISLFLSIYLSISVSSLSLEERS